MSAINRCSFLLAAVLFAAGCGGSTQSIASSSLPNPAVLTGGVHRSGLWVPLPGTTWQWQLTTPPAVEPIDDAQMYDIDMFDNDAAKVAQLHGTGSKVICYIDAGTWENWRPDAGKFPKVVLGKNNGWPGERFLDIRRIDILGPIMKARVDKCAAKKFDGVEFDNVDIYQADSGFPLTANDELTYNRFVAGLAHSHGLSAALKNDPDQVKQLLPDFEFAVVEQCFQYSYCAKEVPFVQAGKAVFETEYALPTGTFCAKARTLHFSAMRKRLALDRWREPCWP